MTDSHTTLSAVLTVAIPVSDQDRSKALLEGLGFAATMDAELQPGFRWIELALPGADTTVSLVAAGEELRAGIDTGIRFATPDARAARTTLEGLGLDVGELLDWERRRRCSRSSTPTGTATTSPRRADVVRAIS